MSLIAKEERLVRLSAAIALGRADVLATLRRSAPPGEPDRTWREVVLQTHLFAGFPRVVEACGVLAAHGGLGVPEEAELEDAADPAAGRALFDAIYGDQSAEVRAALRSFHPLLERWVAEHAYARGLARGGLAADRRELCAVAALAVLGSERQLAAHARGAVRLGAPRDDVEATLTVIADLIEDSRRERVREIALQYAR